MASGTPRRGRWPRPRASRWHVWDRSQPGGDDPLGRRPSRRARSGLRRSLCCPSKCTKAGPNARHATGQPHPVGSPRYPASKAVEHASVAGTGVEAAMPRPSSPHKSASPRHNCFTSSGTVCRSHHKNRMLLGFMWLTTTSKAPFSPVAAARCCAVRSPDAPGRRTSTPCFRAMLRGARQDARPSSYGRRPTPSATPRRSRPCDRCIRPGPPGASSWSHERAPPRGAARQAAPRARVRLEGPPIIDAAPRPTANGGKCGGHEGRGIVKDSVDKVDRPSSLKHVVFRVPNLARRSDAQEVATAAFERRSPAGIRPAIHLPSQIPCGRRLREPNTCSEERIAF